MENNRFSDELAFSIANPSSYSRGKEYFENGCVEKIWEEAGEYKALVRGTEIYEVSVKFGDDGELEYECGCPYESDGACKHVVAAILQFSKNTQFVKYSESKKSSKNKVDIQDMVSKAEPYQIRIFMENALAKDSRLAEDFNIFLRGQEQTPVTVNDYVVQFRRKLEKLDLKDLLESWYAEEEYFEDDYRSGSAESLAELVSELAYPARQCEENGNIGEALKIYQAMLKALVEKRESLSGDFRDLLDLFDNQIGDVLDWYIQSLDKAGDASIKKTGTSYLTSLFQDMTLKDNQSQIGDGLRKVIATRQEAMQVLEQVGALAKKSSLNSAESSLLAHLCRLVGSDDAFEKISTANLIVNPNLALDLLKFYWEKGLKEKVLEVSGNVLKNLKESERPYDGFDSYSSHSNGENEVAIRRFLKDILSPQSDYEPARNNLEELFLVTGLMDDYRLVTKIFRSEEEKERFWQKIENKFNDEYEAKIPFKVFELENRKYKVLNLVRKFPKAECFPEMVAFIQGDFPRECFVEYQRKIEELLTVPKTENYPTAARHLKKMQKIGLAVEFADFLNSLKIRYSRRPRLVEELRHAKL